MSCTIAALPFLLLAAIISTVADNAATSAQIAAYKTEDKEYVKRCLRDEIKQTLHDNQGEVSEEQIKAVCKEYKTVFMDKDVLVKTLQEYGLEDFSMEDEKITAQLDTFNLDFYREDTKLPYMMKISCNQDCDETTLFSDLNCEYALNVQEETYIKIKERLADKNLKIDEEEVLEDDSIMLTVNLD